MKETNTKTYTVLDDSDREILKILNSIKEKLHILYRQFFFFLIMTVLVIGLSLIYYFKYTDKSFLTTVILIIIIIVCAIFFIFSSFLALVRLIWDRKRIINKIQEKFSNRFIIAYFWNSGKRFTNELCIISEDNKIFHNKGLYDVKWLNIWLDDKRRATSFYYENNSSPLEITPQYNILTDAESMKSWRDTEFTNEIIKEKGEGMSNTTLFIIFGVIIVIILLIIAFKSGGGNIQTVKNITGIK